jgi:hypothetical protein
MQRIIGFHGKVGCGKDTAVEIIKQEYGENNVEHLSFAKPLKDVVKLGFNLTDEQVYDPIKKELPIHGNTHITPRMLLQQWGTDILRPILGNDIFTRSVLNKIKESDKRIVVISDVRFDNEAELVRLQGGSIVHIFRQGYEGTSQNTHASEMPIHSDLVNFVLFNDEGLDKYRDSVRKLVDEILSD